MKSKLSDIIFWTLAILSTCVIGPLGFIFVVCICLQVALGFIISAWLAWLDRLQRYFD